jgi:hypothetical protein
MIELPLWAVPNGATVTYVDFGGFLVPGLGGEVQRLNRMGNRHRISVSFPPAPSHDKGRILVNRLRQGKTEGIRIEFPLLSFKPGSPGAPKVDGAGQAGRLLAVDGFTPHYAYQEGQWFSLLHNGRHYLHSIDTAGMANASGQAVLSITPMLRVEPNDNDELHFARPMIEGYIMGEEWQWSMSLAHHLMIEAEIEEAA